MAIYLSNRTCYRTTSEPQPTRVPSSRITWTLLARCVGDVCGMDSYWWVVHLVGCIPTVGITLILIELFVYIVREGGRWRERGGESIERLVSDLVLLNP